MANDATRSAQELQAGLFELAHSLQHAEGISDDSKLAEAVGTAARLAGAERSILRMIDDRGRVLARYAWAADGKIDDPLQGDRFDNAGEIFAWTIKRYLAGEITMVERPEDLPPEAESERAFLLKRGVRSWLSIPFRSRGVAIGYQSFETLSYTKRWSEEEISALRLMAEILAATIMRLRAEEAGHQSEERFFRVFHDHPDAMVITRLRDGTIVECNPAWVQAAGLQAASEAIGRPVMDFASGVSSEIARDIGRTLAVKGATEDIEVRTTGPEGRERIVLASTALIDFSGEACVLTTVRDVTEHNRLQDQLLQAQKMEAVGLLAGGIAHDFNNMLTVIRGHSEMLMAELEGPLAESARAIEDAAERSTRLTRQLLMFSRRDVQTPVVLDPNRLIEQLEPMLRSTLGETVQLATELDTEVPGVLADPSRLEQALLNLALNAREACSQGQGEIVLATHRVRLRPGDHPSLEPGDYVALEVRDDGPGIGAEILDRVTEPFFTTKPQGSGLGLAIVHGVAQQCEGALELESEPGCGTIARILLPVANSTPTQASVATQPDPITLAPAEAALNVLLVEDEEMVRALGRRVFEAAGHRVIEAADGLEALERAQQIPGGPDVLVTDVVMPRMGGLSLARELRRLLPSLAIVVVSGYPDGASDADASDLPADAVFLLKPFKPADLLAAIADARTRVG